MTDFRKHSIDNMILKFRVGSHLYGTNTPESDEDFSGVFMPHENTVFGFERAEEVFYNVFPHPYRV